MTSTTFRVPALALATPAAQRRAAIDADMRLLADQLQRCSSQQSRWAQVACVAEELRSFAASHVVSVAVIGAFAVGGLWLLG